MTDEQVIENVIEGDTHLFSEIVNRYKDRVFSLVYRFTCDYGEAQDVSQEVFLNIYKNLGKFDKRAKFSTWLYRVGYNMSVDWYRKNKRKLKNLLMEQEKQDTPDLKYDLEKSIIRRQQETALRNSILQMKEKYRSPLILFHYENMSYEDIGYVLKLPVKTVETRLYRGRNLLRKSLMDNFNGGEFNELQTGE